MSDVLLTDVINGLAALILLFAFVLVAGVRMHQIIRAYTLGSLALGLLAAAVAYYTQADHIYIVAILTIVLKVIVIPRFLDLHSGPHQGQEGGRAAGQHTRVAPDLRSADLRRLLHNLAHHRPGKL